MSSTDQQTVLRKLKRCHVQYTRATAAVEALEEERLALYLEARRCSPPITFRAIAAVFEVTEAAVMQKLRRAEAGDKAGK